MTNKFNVELKPERNDLIGPVGQFILKSYLKPNETIQELYIDVIDRYAENKGHAERLYNYVSKQWFVLSTPIQRRAPLPISCYLNEMQDDRESITATLFENNWLSMFAGGIGTDWSKVRELGALIGDDGSTTSGVIPFIKMQDSASVGISQGNKRRGSSAAYLHISHPEIEEFITIRLSEGEFNRQCPNVHTGVTVPDSFMHCVEKETAQHKAKEEVIPSWDLISPSTGKVVKTISARDLWNKILKMRIEKSEPYILFIDNVNKNLPDFYVKEGLKITQSNLCSEIMQITSRDRTAVCCLSHVNVAHYLQWKEDPMFIEDCIRFLDNVISVFCELGDQQAFDTPMGRISPFGKATNGARQERSIGLGAMGFVSFLQQERIPLESVAAIGYNKQIFKLIKERAYAATVKLAEEKGPCPDAAKHGVMVRNVNLLAIAPNATSGLVAGVSPSIEPFQGNIQRRLLESGSYDFVNPALMSCLEEKNLDPKLLKQVLHQISTEEGSVQKVEGVFTDLEKEIFKTGFEIDQNHLVRLNADRVEYICQSQSFSLFLDYTSKPSEVRKIHMNAWKLGVKSLYYSFPKAVKSKERISRVTTFNNTESFMVSEAPKTIVLGDKDYTYAEDALEDGPDECLMCQ